MSERTALLWERFDAIVVDDSGQTFTVPDRFKTEVLRIRLLNVGANPVAFWPTRTGDDVDYALDAVIAAGEERVVSVRTSIVGLRCDTAASSTIVPIVECRGVH